MTWVKFHLSDNKIFHLLKIALRHVTRFRSANLVVGAVATVIRPSESRWPWDRRRISLYWLTEVSGSDNPTLNCSIGHALFVKSNYERTDVYLKSDFAYREADFFSTAVIAHPTLIRDKIEYCFCCIPSLSFYIYFSDNSKHVYCAMHSCLHC